MSGAGQGEAGAFPVSAGVLFGLGLGGFFDGIVLHQVLQWHHMLSSAGYPPDSVANLQVNTFWDGVFHSATYALVLLGLALFFHRDAWIRVGVNRALELVGLGTF